jgi:ATP-dependent DNA helicase RecG
MNFLDQPAKNLKGVGEKTDALLEKAGLKTIRDIFYYLPRAYNDFGGVAKIINIVPGKVTIKGKIENIATTRRRANLTITEAAVRDSSEAVRVVWFNQPYRAKQFKTGEEYIFSGEYGFSYGRYQITNPSVSLAKDAEVRAMKPVYKKSGALTSVMFSKIINAAKSDFAKIPAKLPDIVTKNFPSDLSRADALFLSHFPETESQTVAARKYLAFEELFEFILASNLNKQENSKLKSAKIPFEAKKMQEIVAKLPFKLTNAQRLSLWEIIQDLDREVPMNRLLQGDVGSGKTVVAGLASFVVALSGGQTAILAPTEILAAQHFESLSDLFAGFNVKLTLLTGSTKNKTKVKEQIKNGQIDIIIGTHALLTDDTEFKNLQFAIIDEQHRFGVNQRQKLLSKSLANRMPHLLAMTATPIPRTLQLTVFGDVNVSILNELPAGRQKIITKILPPASSDTLYDKIRAEITGGRQAYYICKTIEDTDESELKNVKKETEKLRARFPDAKIDFIHGKMKSAEKDDIMQKFSQNKINILVSTTVVEVGVNVPNATVIAITDADFYGLAQLHQLRGRVGRGQAQSCCYLITSDNEKPSRRLDEMVNSSDGFYLAEVDLKLRGPGAIYGTLQHGALDLKIASVGDTKLVKQAADSVKTFLQSGENLLKYKELASDVHARQKLTNLN